MAFQIGLLVALLVTPIPAFLAAQAKLELVAAGMLALMALAMIFAVRRL
jgi:hypothetical protein